MGLANIKTLEKIGSFAVPNQVIPAMSTWEAVVDLGSDRYQIVEVVIRIHHAAPTTLERRKSIFLVATRDINQAYSQTNDKKTTIVTGYNGINYYVYSWLYTGYSYAVDGFLSAYGYDNAASSIRVDSARIDGSNLRIVFRNAHATLARTLNVLGVIKSGTVAIE